MTDPRQADVEVGKFSSPQRSETLAVLARAFWPDPLFGWFVADRLDEHHKLAHIFAAFLADAIAFDECYVARAGARIVGAAVWVPPGGMPRTRGREAMMQVRIGRMLVTGRNRRTGLALLDAVDKAHPHDPHWYLALLGADPLVQGRGVGSKLLAPVLARADADGLPAYLETQKEENLAFYGRHGFEVVQEVRLPKAPPVWAMQRAPR